jgi:hypothetical protein
MIKITTAVNSKLIYIVERDVRFAKRFEGKVVRRLDPRFLLRNLNYTFKMNDIIYITESLLNPLNNNSGMKVS